MSHVFQEIIKVKVSSECMVKMPWNENERGKESKKGTTLQQVFTVRSFRVFRMKFAKWMQCLFVYSLTYMICVFWVHTLESQYARVCVLSVSVIYSSTLKIKSRVDSMKRITSNKTHINIFHTFIIPPKMEVHRKKLVWRFSVCSLLILCIQIIWFHFALIPP